MITTKIIVAGSRNFKDWNLLKQKCDYYLQNIEEPIEIVSGTAFGADKMGETYAAYRKYSVKRFPALWNTHGKSAGFIRNKTMAEYADHLIAFWDGESHGTKNMIETAIELGLKVRIVNFKP